MNHSETITIECTINGMPFQLHAAPGMPLSELLREQGLLSVKQGCCVGECGACTVLVDGTAIDSCLFLAAGLKPHCFVTKTSFQGVQCRRKDSLYDIDPDHTRQHGL